MYAVSNPNRNSFILSILMTSIQLIFIVSIILFIVICCNESIRFSEVSSSCSDNFHPAKPDN